MSSIIQKKHSSLNYFVLKTLQARVRTTPPDVLSSVKKLKPLLRGPVLLKKSEPSLRVEWINTHTPIIFRPADIPSHVTSYSGVMDTPSPPKYSSTSPILPIVTLSVRTAMASYHFKLCYEPNKQGKH